MHPTRDYARTRVEGPGRGGRRGTEEIGERVSRTGYAVRSARCAQCVIARDSRALRLRAAAPTDLCWPG